MEYSLTVQSVCFICALDVMVRPYREIVSSRFILKIYYGAKPECYERKSSQMLKEKLQCRFVKVEVQSPSIRFL